MGGKSTRYGGGIPFIFNTNSVVLVGVFRYICMCVCICTLVWIGKVVKDAH